MKSLDSKSILIGLAVGVVAMLLMGQVAGNGQVGKYQMVIQAGSLYILDTTTPTNVYVLNLGTDEATLHQLKERRPKE